MVLSSLYKPNSNNTEYIIYDMDSIAEAVEYVNDNTTSADLVFTGDTAIAAEMKNENLAKITSPWVYRGTNLPFYCDQGNNNIYCYDKKYISQLLLSEKPKFIVGANRTTIRTFFDGNYDSNNYPLENIFHDNYYLVKQTKNIYIYMHKDIN